jgi:hypothetical protein
MEEVHSQLAEPLNRLSASPKDIIADIEESHTRFHRHLLQFYIVAVIKAVQLP